MNAFYTTIEAAALALALSADALAAGFAYGAAKIKIPFLSGVIIGFVGSMVLAVALVTGTITAPFLPAGLSTYLSFGILSVLGLVKLADTGAGSPKHDFDRNKVLSITEAALLSAALSLDSLAAGFSAGLGNLNLYAVIALSFLFTTAAVLFGASSGRRLHMRSTANARFFGLILIALAVSKLF